MLQTGNQKDYFSLETLNEQDTKWQLEFACFSLRRIVSYICFFPMQLRAKSREWPVQIEYKTKQR